MPIVKVHDVGQRTLKQLAGSFVIARPLRELSLGDQQIHAERRGARIVGQALDQALRLLQTIGSLHDLRQREHRVHVELAGGELRYDTFGAFGRTQVHHALADIGQLIGREAGEIRPALQALRAPLRSAEIRSRP